MSMVLQREKKLVKGELLGSTCGRQNNGPPKMVSPKPCEC